MEWGSSGTNNSNNQTSTTQNNAISEASSEGKKLNWNLKGSSEARTS